jgi:hypothetical protein
LPAEEIWKREDVREEPAHILDLRRHPTRYSASLRATGEMARTASDGNTKLT